MLSLMCWSWVCLQSQLGAGYVLIRTDDFFVYVNDPGIYTYICTPNLQNMVCERRSKT